MNQSDESSKKEIKIGFAPSFFESMQDIPEEDRAAIMAEIELIGERLKANPYAGTPLSGGIIAVFQNFIKRKLWDLHIRWQR